MREKSRIGDALGAVFGAKLGVTEVSDPGTRCISRTRTLLIWLGGPMGWASMKNLSGPAHGLEPTAQQLRPLRHPNTVQVIEAFQK